MKRYYLAYGSNLNIRQMRYRCPTAKPIGTGAYLTIEPKKDGLVPIAVWEVTEADEKRLDAYEGCPTFYYKRDIRLTVKLVNGKNKRLDAFIYIMHEERRHGIPSLTYIRTCEEGYRNFGFDTKFLDAAYEISAKEVQR